MRARLEQVEQRVSDEAEAANAALLLDGGQRRPRGGCEFGGQVEREHRCGGVCRMLSESA